MVWTGAVPLYLPSYQPPISPLYDAAGVLCMLAVPEQKLFYDDLPSMRPYASTACYVDSRVCISTRSPLSILTPLPCEQQLAGDKLCGCTKNYRLAA